MHEHEHCDHHHDHHGHGDQCHHNDCCHDHDMRDGHHHEHHQGGCCDHDHHQDGCCEHHQDGCCDHDHHDHCCEHDHDPMTSVPLTLANFFDAEALDRGAWDFEEDDDEYVEPPFTTFEFVHQGTTWQVSQWGNPADMPLVLLHGFMQTAATWNFVAPELAHDHCVYALDFVGHGSSDKPHEPEAYAYDAVVEAVGAFLREVACVHPETHAARKAHVVGYSMGGRVAVQVALRNPQQVYSVILESCGLGPADEEERLAAEQRNKGWAQQLRHEGIEAFVALWEELSLFASQKQRNLAAKVRPERLANDPEALALCLEGMGKHAMPYEADTVGALVGMWLPVKYIWGVEDATCERPAHCLSHEGFDVSAVGVGHNVHLEAPMAYVGNVQHFLSSIELKGLR